MVHVRSLQVAMFGGSIPILVQRPSVDGGTRTKAGQREGVLPHGNLQGGRWHTPLEMLDMYAGWWFQPLGKKFVSWDDYSQYMGKYKMFQTTNQYVCIIPNGNQMV